MKLSLLFEEVLSHTYGLWLPVKLEPVDGLEAGRTGHVLSLDVPKDKRKKIVDLIVNSFNDADIMQYFYPNPNKAKEKQSNEEKALSKLDSIKAIGEHDNGIKIVVNAKSALTPQELEIIRSKISGQASDGWGEGFSQGEHLGYYISVWENNNSDVKVLAEAKKNELKSFKDNKVPLTDEERSEVMKKKAVWHHGSNGEETPAVWKSKDKDGNITYVTNTHRAYNTAKSLGAIINKYHNFIKSTS